MQAPQNEGSAKRTLKIKQRQTKNPKIFLKQVKLVTVTGLLEKVKKR
jgi:hypothetical protein